MPARDGRVNVAEGLEWNSLELPVPAGDVVGTTVGKYDILEEIGRGGMGVVYRARQRGLEREVALKALHAAAGLGVGAGEALVRESRIAGSLNHPNIVTVYEFLEEGETPYIAMEYVQRGSLRPWMGAMSLAQFTGVFEELLAGLAAVEPSGIVHRDLKPENVMVTADGRVKIADFGIAKATQRAGSIAMASTPTGITVGTPTYMAPEQALCEEVGPYTDLYSVGIMAYEHLVGHVPFRDARTPMAILLSHINDPVPPAAEVQPRVDRALSDWVGRLLVKDPAERTDSPVFAWDELEEIVIGRLGPMWRREARLTERSRVRISPRQLDPSQFNSQTVTMGPAGASIPTLAPTPTPATPRAPRAPQRSTLKVPPRVVPAQSRRRSTPMWPLAIASVAAIGAGFAISRTLASNPVLRGIHASAGALTVSLPEGWRRASTPVGITGYSFKEPLSVIPASDMGGITLGITTAPTASLLPPALLAAGSKLPRRETVELGRKEFFRYSDATLATTAKASIYTLPTTTGVLVGVCRLPASNSSTVNAGCEQALASVTDNAGEALPLKQSTAYTTAVVDAIGHFNSETNRLASSLQDARTPGGQAHLANELKLASTVAAGSVRAAKPGPSEQAVNSAIARALDGTAAGYATMAQAAGAQRPGRWRSGAAKVATESTALQAALRELRTSA